MTEELDPKTFDINAWLDDAHLPEESTRIFKRADLLGRITALQEKLKDEAAADGDNLAGSVEFAKAAEEYEALLEEFGASALTVYVSAVPSSKVREIQKEHGFPWGKPTGGKKEALEEARELALIELNYAVLAEAVVAVAGPDGQRVAVNWSVEDLKKMEDRIGSGQFQDIIQAKYAAESRVREPNADFLAKLSGGSSDDSEDS